MPASPRPTSYANWAAMAGLCVAFWANCSLVSAHVGVIGTTESQEPGAPFVKIISPLEAVVNASPEGKQTDFTAKLVEVRADGYARIIEEGIRRGPDSIDGQPVVAMEPGRVYKFTIDLRAVAIRIKKGHRMRVEVSSSNFPKYSRNPNTGECAERASKFIRVRQRVHHSVEYPSHIVLPIVP